MLSVVEEGTVEGAVESELEAGVRAAIEVESEVAGEAEGRINSSSRLLKGKKESTFALRPILALSSSAV